MGICPVCNGFSELSITCTSCGSKMDDKGRVMDYFDDYSPYMPIEQMKLVDGITDDRRLNQCPHLLRCTNCGVDQVILVDE